MTILSAVPYGNRWLVAFAYQGQQGWGYFREPTPDHVLAVIQR